MTHIGAWFSSLSYADQAAAGVAAVVLTLVVLMLTGAAVLDWNDRRNGRI